MSRYWRTGCWDSTCSSRRFIDTAVCSSPLAVPIWISTGKLLNRSANRVELYQSRRRSPSGVTMAISVGADLGNGTDSAIALRPSAPSVCKSLFNC